MKFAVKISGPQRFALATVAVGVLIAGIASAAELDFSNPAVVLSSKAVVDSGVCIAKYTVQLNDASKSVADVAQAVARRCDKEIALSAGLATLLVGKPDDFSVNLKYARDELTAHAVERYRANTETARVAQIR
jgi:hypothetical protein